jgi:hypothetical protein
MLRTIRQSDQSRFWPERDHPFVSSGRPSSSAAWSSAGRANWCGRGPAGVPASALVATCAATPSAQHYEEGAACRHPRTTSRRLAHRWGDTGPARSAARRSDLAALTLVRSRALCRGAQLDPGSSAWPAGKLPRITSWAQLDPGSPAWPAGTFPRITSYGGDIVHGWPSVGTPHFGADFRGSCYCRLSCSYSVPASWAAAWR